MRIDGNRIFNVLKTIAFTRPAGTEKELVAATLIKDEILSMGFSPSIENFEIDDADVDAYLEVLEPYQKTYFVKGFKHAKSTPCEGVQADFLYADDVTEANSAELSGKLCMIDNMTCSFDKLLSCGPAGMLHVEGKATDSPDEFDLYQASFDSLEKRDKMTSFTISGRDAFDMVKRGAKRVSFCLNNRSYQARSQNIVVTIEGSEKPEEIIAVGAHYDSVPVGDGASDNAAGSAIIMEILRSFVATKPRRTMKFIWFGSEEIGLEGSKAYLAVHEQELDAYRLMVNVDVAGSTMGHNFVRVTADESVSHYLNYLAKEVGYSADIKQGLMGSDSTAFAWKNIPSVGFGRAQSSALQFCHSRHDTTDYISPQALEETAEFVSLFIHKICDSLIIPIPELIPESVAKRAKEMIEKNRQ